MEIREKKQVTELTVITTAIKCDVCGNVHKGAERPKSWHYFYQSHQEWGDDSGDSCEGFDVCSAECYLTKLEECIDDIDGYAGAVADGFNVKFAKKLINTLKK